mmetsp:Transcript_106655/g.189607  ORF Transcript_106655/g.189607 Transcript_106655/m.189607 type:complete len:292 (-) Transcript_106655:17-892(-)
MRMLSLSPAEALQYVRDLQSARVSRYPSPVAACLAQVCQVPAVHFLKLQLVLRLRCSRAQLSAAPVAVSTAPVAPPGFLALGLSHANASVPRDLVLLSSAPLAAPALASVCAPLSTEPLAPRVCALPSVAPWRAEAAPALPAVPPRDADPEPMAENEVLPSHLALLSLDPILRYLALFFLDPMLQNQMALSFRHPFLSPFLSDQEYRATHAELLFPLLGPTALVSPARMPLVCALALALHAVWTRRDHLLPLLLAAHSRSAGAESSGMAGCTPTPRASQELLDRDSPRPAA